MVDYYFAYGSNMNPARMASRGLRYRQALAGRLHGYRLRFNKVAHGKVGVAYANIAHHHGEMVEGVLYQLEHAQDIALMDVYEGCPVRYSREIFTVAAAEQRIVPAWVYVANPAWIDDNVLPEQRYLGHLLAGKAWHSDDYHQQLRQQPTLPGTDDTQADSLRLNV